MRNRLWPVSFALAIALGYPPATWTQDSQPSKAANTSSKEQADLSGVWMFDQPPPTSTQYYVYQLTPDEPPLTPWGQAQYEANKSSFGVRAVPLEETNDPVFKHCYPPGLPRIFAHPFPMQIVQEPGEVLMLFEYDSLRRQIFTDGRPHDKKLGPLWMGDSIGHWEGGVLVVDTLNFNDKTWLDRIGHPHSDALHLVERMRRIDHDHLTDDLTINDPKAYTKPWTAHLAFVLKPTWTLGEQFCEDGESFLKIEKLETGK